MKRVLLFILIMSAFHSYAQMENEMLKTEKNVLGITLASCCTSPMTGYFRDGYCRTRQDDYGTHVVCAIMTEDFLQYTKSRGNDLSTPIPHWNFPGLKAGDKWCLCVLRWMEAEKAGVAPKIYLEATDEKALAYTSLELLQKYAID